MGQEEDSMKEIPVLVQILNTCDLYFIMICFHTSLQFIYCWISLQGVAISLLLDLSPRCFDFIIIESLSKVLRFHYLWIFLQSAAISWACNIIIIGSISKVLWFHWAKLNCWNSNLFLDLGCPNPAMSIFPFKV